jgi:hypothetical protein
LANVTGLAFSVTANTTYKFDFDVLFRATLNGSTTCGLKVGLTFPAATIVSATAQIPVAADGTAAMFSGWITSSGDAVTGTGVQAKDVDYVAKVYGVIRPSADGTLQVQAAAELTSTIAGIVVRQNSAGTLTTIA